MNTKRGNMILNSLAWLARSGRAIAQVACVLVLLGWWTPASIAQPCTAPCRTCIPPGPVPDDTIWTRENSPYCVRGNITIGTLTIEDGVSVLVDGPYSMDVRIGIHVMGTAARPVTITSRDPAARWHGIVITNTDTGSEFNWCTISRSDTSAIRINDGFAPTLRHCSITDNTKAGNGGGIEAIVTFGNFIIEDCTFSRNTATVHGGALRVSMTSGLPLRMTGCDVRQNTSNMDNTGTDRVGGGLYLSGSATLTKCTFDGNQCYGSCFTTSCFAAARGSALYCDGSGAVELRACAVLNGRVHTTYPPPGGGSGFGYSRSAVYHAGSGTLLLSNCVVACNTSTGSNPGDGAIWVDSGDVTITNTTIARNTYYGIQCAGGTVTVRNTILHFNHLTSGPPPVYGAQFAGTVAFEYSNVQGGVPGCTSCIPFDPGFMGIGCCPQAFKLFASSPCVDRGDIAINDGCQPPGLRGQRSDMGAFGGPDNCDWGLVQGCTADVDNGSGSGTIDCGVTIDDLLYYLRIFTDGAIRADLDDGTMTGTPDGGVTIDDLLFFLARYEAGC